MNNLKRGVATLSALLVTALVTLTAPTAALADTGGGTGGGGGGGTTTSGFEWRSVAGEKGDVYDTFLEKSGQTQTFAESEIKNRVDGGIAVCKKSNVIWWVHSTQSGRWVYNYSGATHGSSWNGSGSIEDPKTTFGRAPTKAEVEIFKEWDESRSGGSVINSSPGYTIICSGAKVPDDKTSSEVEKDSEEVPSDYTKTAVYSYSTTVSPVKIEGKYPGNGSYEAQAATVSKTEFGKLYDQLVTSGQTNTPAQIKTKVEAALAADDAATVTSAVTLSAANKAAFAKGGVLNVSEYRTRGTIKAHKTDTQYKQRTCYYVQKWNGAKGDYDAKVKDTSKAGTTNGCTAWETYKTVAGVTEVTQTFQTAENTGFWQLISVHCNKAQFDALVSATGATALNSGDSTKAISAVAQSKKYASQPATLDFADPNNTNAAAKASATMGFYDKECSFDCIASSSTADGASDANGATKNVGTSGTSNGNKNGAVSGGINGNSLEFFRDNDPKTITLDVWYPKTSGVVNYKGNASAAITTTISRWAEGTPSTTATSGGKFVMTTPGGTTLFTGSSTATTQKNWDTTTASNSNFTILNGLQRDFNVRASWASEKDKPQVINVKWEYAPAVSSTFPTTLGFSRTASGNSAKTADATATSTAIQGKCYANYGTTTSSSTVDLFQQNTGSGTTNNLEGKIVGGVGTNPKDVATNLVINFVRATTE